MLQSKILLIFDYIKNIFLKSRQLPESCHVCTGCWDGGKSLSVFDPNGKVYCRYELNPKTCGCPKHTYKEVLSNEIHGK